MRLHQLQVHHWTDMEKQLLTQNNPFRLLKKPVIGLVEHLLWLLSNKKVWIDGSEQDRLSVQYRGVYREVFQEMAYFLSADERRRCAFLSKEREKAKRLHQLSYIKQKISRGRFPEYFKKKVFFLYILLEYSEGFSSIRKLLLRRDTCQRYSISELSDQTESCYPLNGNYGYVTLDSVFIRVRYIFSGSQPPSNLTYPGQYVLYTKKHNNGNGTGVLIFGAKLSAVGRDSFSVL